MDWDATQYKKYSQPQKERGIKVVKDFPFKGNEVVLDIGCGDGKTTVEIAKRVPHGKVIGIDPSFNMIEEAKKRYSQVKNLSFQQKGAEDFSFESQKFDLIVSFFALHYVKDNLAVLKKIRKVLKPEGKMILRLCGEGQKEMKEVFNREPWKAIFAKQKTKLLPQTEKDYQQFLEQAGFENFQIKTENVSDYFTNKEELFNWIFVWVPFVTGLDQDKSIEITQELVEATLQNQKQKGKISMNFPLLLIDIL